MSRLTQSKISETWYKLPKDEIKLLQKEESTRRRHELREAKINIWKKWRKRQEKIHQGDKQRKARSEDKDKKWLAKLEETLDRLRREEQARKEARRKIEDKGKILLAERKIRQEEILRKVQEKHTGR